MIQNDWCAFMACSRVRHFWKHQGLSLDSSRIVCSRAGSQTSMVWHSMARFPSMMVCSVLGENKKSVATLYPQSGDEPMVLQLFTSRRRHPLSYLQRATHLHPPLQATGVQAEPEPWRIHCTSLNTAQLHCSTSANTAGLAAGISVSWLQHVFEMGLLTGLTVAIAI